MGLSDITLTSGLSFSLLSLKKTAKQMEQVHERLSSGKKVNSSLDNPTNFFIAQQLKNQADDLTQVQQNITESIQTIKTAANGITGVIQLVNQMKAVVDSARNTTDPQAKSALAASYDELYAQLNYMVSDSSYRGLNVIGDNDPSLLGWKADDLPVSLNPNGSSEYIVEGKFLGAGYALYEAGAPDVGWVPDDRGTRIAPVTADITEFPEPALISLPLDFVFVLDATGSMGPYLTQVKANVQAFVESMQAQGVDGRYAFAKYGDINPSQGGEAPVLTPPVFYTDAAAFSAALNASPNSLGGGDIPESGLEGILTTLSDLSFRPEATKRMVLLTDAVVHTTADGMSADTIAGTAASLTAAGIRLDVAAPLGGAVQAQLGPLAAATGGSYFSITDSSFYTGGFGFTPDTTIPTSEPVILSADYAAGEFSLFFSNPPPGEVKVMTSEKAGIGVYHSWLYDGFNSSEGITAASNDLDAAITMLRTQSQLFGSGSSVLTTRDAFTSKQVNLSLEGADNLTNADLDEEASNALMLQVREQIGATTIGMAAKSSENILKLF